jgi:hypothetical protein
VAARQANKTIITERMTHVAIRKQIRLSKAFLASTLGKLTSKSPISVVKTYSWMNHHISLTALLHFM